MGVIATDYIEIGKRIKKRRRALELTQEQLAERVDISLPHMSHIETGNTKLSLPVLVEIANALDVPTDYLIFGESTHSGINVNELAQILEGCAPHHERIILAIARAAREALDKCD